MAKENAAQGELLAAGGTAQLRSGGPKMTVTKLGDDGWANVAWFDKDNQLQQATLPVVALVVAG